MSEVPLKGHLRVHGYEWHTVDAFTRVPFVHRSMHRACGVKRGEKSTLVDIERQHHLTLESQRLTFSVFRRGSHDGASSEGASGL